MNRNDLQKLTQERLDEASLLFVATKFSGAYYLAGYVVELALKACIARKTKHEDFYDKDIAKNCFVHDLLQLVKVANLRPDLDIARKANLDLDANWSVACMWTESKRYEFNSEADAKALLDAITDPTNGVLPWIKAYW